MEYAREYINELNRKYNEDDLLKIATEQISREDSIASNFEQEFIFLDTDLITLKIWSVEKYGRCQKWILDQIASRSYDLYLLCKPDIPWSFDPLRENKLDRGRLFKRYESELYQYNKKFKIVDGLGENRTNNAIEIINDHFLGT